MHKNNNFLKTKVVTKKDIFNKYTNYFYFI